MSPTAPLRLYVGPHTTPDITAAVAGLPVVLVDQSQAEAVVWLGGDPAVLRERLHADNRWVQLRSAGIERFIDEGVVDADRTWTSAAGAYSEMVSEHAVALLLAGVRGVGALARRRTWDREGAFTLVGRLAGSTVAVVGAGGIGRAIIARLRPFGVRLLAVNLSGRPVDGADGTIPIGELRSTSGIDHLMLALPDTPQSRGVVDAELLARLTPNSWIVNVGRGGAVDEAALLDSLRSRSIGGAALDVTAKEPLPDGHPFWELDNVIITPHTANTPASLDAAFAERLRENILRYLAAQPLLGEVDLVNGY